jgi:hypothetical protein
MRGDYLRDGVRSEESEDDMRSPCGSYASDRERGENREYRSRRW